MSAAAAEGREAVQFLHECVRCGICMEGCPTFGESGSEGRGPRGRVALMQQLCAGTLGRTHVLDDRIFSC
ncbi:MAG TPA: 4Fe-4S dicluster domain-containing protein, partial [Dissulfurispiraceae bacterium]|nr:4Fe-4S dicluster domain-containing protein [Dissulfurispiraceae bacterium]